MKAITILLAAALAALLASPAYAGGACPFSDESFKQVLQKASIDRLSNPASSVLSKEEIKSMVLFYLANPDISYSDCFEGDIEAKARSADAKISDDVLKKLGSRLYSEQCSACSDGTACGNENGNGQLCNCLDMDRDPDAYELCKLNPVALPLAGVGPCTKCRESFDCGQGVNTPDGEYRCFCDDLDGDGDNDACYPRLMTTSTTTTSTTSSSTSTSSPPTPTTTLPPVTGPCASCPPGTYTCKISCDGSNTDLSGSKVLYCDCSGGYMKVKTSVLESSYPCSQCSGSPTTPSTTATSSTTTTNPSGGATTTLSAATTTTTLFPSPTCSETDGGKNYPVKGVLTAVVLGMKTTLTDACLGTSMVKEYYCGQYNLPETSYAYCKDGSSCTDGACEVEGAPTPTTSTTTTLLPGTACKGRAQYPSASEECCSGLSKRSNVFYSTVSGGCGMADTTKPYICVLIDGNCDTGYMENQCNAPEDCTGGSGTCDNECNSEGDKQCSGNGYQTCGSFDQDACLDWSSVTACLSGETCSGNGVCSGGGGGTTTCVPLSIKSGTVCSVCNSAGNGYLDDNSLCQPGETCSNGACSGGGGGGGCTPICKQPNEVACGQTNNDADSCGSTCNVVGTYCSSGTCNNGDCGTGGGPCTDSDGGSEFSEKGTVVDKDGVSKTDECQNTATENNRLVEYYCASDGTWAYINWVCASGQVCENGVCTACTPSCLRPDQVACGYTYTEDDGCGTKCDVAGTSCYSSGGGTCTDGKCV